MDSSLKRPDMDTFLVNYSEPVWGMQVGEVEYRIHPAGTCDGEFCTFHKPSDHPLKDAPINVRGDTGVIERLCEHGVGHPDPDHIQWRIDLDILRGQNIHGCDGCCAK